MFLEFPILSHVLLRRDKQQQIFTTKSQQIDSTLTGEDDIPSKVHQGIVIERGDMKNTNEKADNILVLQMVFAATENQKGVSFITDYTDLFCCA